MVRSAIESKSAIRLESERKDFAADSLKCIQQRRMIGEHRRFFDCGSRDCASVLLISGRIHRVEK